MAISAADGLPLLSAKVLKKTQPHHITSCCVRRAESNRAVGTWSATSKGHQRLGKVVSTELLLHNPGQNTCRRQSSGKTGTGFYRDAALRVCQSQQRFGSGGMGELQGAGGKAPRLSLAADTSRVKHQLPASSQPGRTSQVRSGLAEVPAAALLRMTGGFRQL